LSLEIDEVKKAAEDRDISKVVIASRGGKSAIKLAESMGKSVQVISVSEFSYGDDVKKKMKKLKMVPVENADLLIQDSKEMKESLLKQGVGVKAAMEAAVLAKNRGFVEGEFMATAGSKSSLDTLLLVYTNHSEEEALDPIDQVSIKEILVSPLLKHTSLFYRGHV
jgi:hypothetical protein